MSGGSGEALRHLASQPLIDLHRHHPDKPCLVWLHVGVPSAEDMDFLAECQAQAAALQCDFSAIAIRANDLATRDWLSQNVPADAHVLLTASPSAAETAPALNLQSITTELRDRAFTPPLGSPLPTSTAQARESLQSATETMRRVIRLQALVPNFATELPNFLAALRASLNAPPPRLPALPSGPRVQWMHSTLDQRDLPVHVLRRGELLNALNEAREAFEQEPIPSQASAQDEEKRFGNFLAFWAPWQQALSRHPDYAKAVQAMDKDFADPAFAQQIETEAEAAMLREGIPPEKRQEASLHHVPATAIRLMYARWKALSERARQDLSKAPT